MSSKKNFKKELRDELSGTLSRALGPDKFFNVLVSADLAPVPVVETNTESEPGPALTYSPYDWNNSAATAGVTPSFMVRSVNVDLTFDSAVAAETRTALADIVKKRLVGYPSKVNAQAFSVSRMPASVPEAEKDKTPVPEKEKKSLGEQLAPWMPLAGSVLLVIGFILLGSAFRSAFTTIAEALRSIGVRISEAKPQPGKEKEIEEPIVAEAIGPSSPPRPGPALRFFSENLDVVRRTLRERPLLAMSALAGATDEELGHLRMLVRYLDVEEKAQLRKLLGARASSMSRLVSKTDSGSSWAPVEWLHDFAIRLAGLEIGGTEGVLSHVPAEHLPRLLSLSPKDFSGIISSEDLLDAKVWRLLSEVMPEDSLAEAIANLPSERVDLILSAPNLNPEEVAPTTEVVMKAIEGLKSKAGVDGATRSDRDEAHLKTRVVPALVAGKKKLTIVEEMASWAGLYERRPDLRDMVFETYWTPDVLAQVVPQDLKTWLSGMDAKTVGTLSYVLRQINLESVADTMMGSLPEGPKKVIATSTQDKWQKTEGADLGTLSELLRAQVERLRLRYKEGGVRFVSTTGADGNTERSAA